MSEEEIRLQKEKAEHEEILSERIQGLIALALHYKGREPIVAIEYGLRGLQLARNVNDRYLVA